MEVVHNEFFGSDDVLEDAAREKNVRLELCALGEELSVKECGYPSRQDIDRVSVALVAKQLVDLLECAVGLLQHRDWRSLYNAS